MNKDAYYFPHFCNARHDRKVMRLRKELGVEGYGIFFMLLEVLREQIDFKYPMKDMDLLADEFGCSEQKLRVVVCNYQLFQVDPGEQFFSPKLILYLQPYFERSEKARQMALKRWGKTEELIEECTSNATALPQHSLSNANKVKEKKVKEKKINIIDAYTSNNNLIQAIKDFKEMRIKINSAMTDHALDLMLKKLDGLADDDETKIKILEQSIMNSWKGLFPLKTDNQPKPTQQQPKQIYQQGNNKREYKDVEALLGIK